MSRAVHLKLSLMTGVALLSGCTLHRPPTLAEDEARVCLERGGHQSRAPFGPPVCQLPYADAGKACSGKADCRGECLSDAPEHANIVAIGTPVAGRCEAGTNTFGCYARVENGKLAERYGCTD
ncbi:hypothetical protein GCM10009087_52650 [Sphingomonas oligophenolica]|uniref:Lipoprotein n=1 Tax=Sphingomonas oligophenolica TaxID=301154 RepID=A0ABU9Y728_9SPHN